MLKKTFNWLDTTFAVILALVLGISLGLYAWLSWTPRDMTAHVPALMQEFDVDFAKLGYDLQLGKVVLKNEGFKAPLLLSIESLKLKNPAGEVLLNIPELKLSPSFWGMLKGKFVPNSVEILGADFAILQDKQGVFYLDTREQAAPTRLDSLFFAADKTSETVKTEDAFSLEHLFELGIGRVNISRASMEYKSELTGFELKLPNFSAHIDSVLLSEEVSGSISASYKNDRQQPALLQSNFHYAHEGKQLKADVNVHQITLSQFAKASAALADLAKVSVPLSGRIESSIVFPNQIEVLNFDLKSKALANLKVKGEVSGTFDQPSFLARGSLGEFDLPFLKKNWPQGVGKDAYRWITSSIRQATVKKGEFNINLTPKDLKQDILPSDAVQAVLHVEDSIIEFVAGFPEVKKANGRVIFAGQTLLAEIDSVRMLSGTKLHPVRAYPFARVRIPDLMVNNVNILIDIPLTAKISDVLEFMKSTPYKLPASFSLNPASMKGRLQGVLSMKVIDQVSPVEDEVDFQLKGDLQNVAYAGLAKGADLSALNGEIKANNAGVEFSASGKFNQQKFDTDLSITKDSEQYHYSGYLPVSVAALASNDLNRYLSGAVDLEADWVQNSGERPRVLLNADTRDMGYSIPDLKIRKVAGQAGNIRANGSASSGRIFLSSLAIDDSQIKFSGSLEVSKKTGNVLKSQMNHLTLGKTKLNGNYFRKGTQHNLTINAEMLDLEPFMGDQSEKQSSGESVLQRLANIPDAVIDVSLDKVRFAEDRELQDLKLTAKCSNKRCQSFSLQTRSGDVPVAAKVGEVDGKRNFSATTPNLGRILRVTGLFDDMRNGSLSLNAVYQDDLPNNPMAGRFALDDFNVKGVPVLAKLLTVATFTGILDVMSGGGLSFQKMVVPFQYDTQKLIIKDARAVGPSLGITADGALDIKPDTLKIEGAVIPAKLLDTVLGGIPIIGEVYKVLTGGEGLVAVNYSMKGKADDPKISVNPLSVLTPGFLRGFFDIFNPSSKQEVEDAKTAEDALKEVEDDVQTMEDEASQEATKEAVQAEEPPQTGAEIEVPVKAVEKESLVENEKEGDYVPSRKKPGSFMREKR
ncbi:MAG: AsmA-like C-terminal domain-containing protein [Rickettsiales bacterium]|nr:AsmA-like C-terminal domain-containing protein [Rickettsiales bacterium]